MRFTTLLTVALAFAFAAAQSATAIGIISDISNLTSTIRSFEKGIRTTNTINALTKGGEILGGLNTLTSRLDTASDKLQRARNVTLSDTDAGEILGAVKLFTNALESYLETVESKYSILKLLLFVRPIRAALEELEGAFESYGVSLVPLVPTQKDEVGKEFKELSNAVDTIKDVFEDLRLT